MKVLITYAYAGIGHKKAAEAVRNALSDFDDVNVTTADILDYTDEFFRFSYPRVYLFLINSVPLLWGFLYYFLDFGPVDKILSPVRRFFNNFFTKGFIEFILKEKPDVVLSTHFLPSEVISDLKKRGLFKGRLITVITDFLSHSFWMAKYSDYFIGAIERTKRDLVRRGVREERVKVLGIPCDPVFGRSGDRIALQAKLGLKKDLFSVLIMSGGFGTGPIRKIVRYVSGLESSMRDKIQIIVICGKNKALFDELNRVKADLKVRLSVFGYMDNIHEFMTVSDCIMTKSGGLTVSESLSKTLPMIIIRPIPGQETRNCRVLTDFGTAVRANTVKQALGYLRDFISLPEKLIGIRTRINLLSYPNAARDIAEFIVQDKGLRHED